MYKIEYVPHSMSTMSWYSNLWQFLENGMFASNLSNKQKRVIHLITLSYWLVHGVLFWKHRNGVILRFLKLHDTKKVLKYLHDGPTGGHYARNTIKHKVMGYGYYWPTLFKDSHSYVRKCWACQRCAIRNQRSVIPLLRVAV